MDPQSPSRNDGATLGSIAITFFRGMYVFALVWLFSFLLWWPIVLPIDRLIYWAPTMGTLVPGSLQFTAMLFSILSAVITAPMMYFLMFGGTPVVIVTAAAMSVIMHVWPKPRSKWMSALAGVVAALLISPISSSYAISMTTSDPGPSDPRIITVEVADVEYLWHMYLLSAYPLGCAFGGYRMGGSFSPESKKGTKA